MPIKKSAIRSELSAQRDIDWDAPKRKPVVTPSTGSERPDATSNQA